MTDYDARNSMKPNPDAYCELELFDFSNELFDFSNDLFDLTSNYLTFFFVLSLFTSET